MSSSYRLLRIGASAALIALLGAGCAKGAKTPATPEQNGQNPGNPNVLMFPPSEEPSPTINEELRTVLRNFQEAKSFHAQLAMNTPNGAATGEFDYLKPSRVKGTFNVPNTPPSEFVIVDDALFIKANGAWVDLSKTPSAKAMGDLLRRGISQPGALQDMGVSDQAVVKKERDNARGCDNYRTVVKAADGSAASLEVCAADGKPKFLGMQMPIGTVNVQYSKYGASFLIEKPTTKVR